MNPEQKPEKLTTAEAEAENVVLKQVPEDEDAAVEPDAETAPLSAKYAIEKELAHGGMGSVYLGRLRSIDKVVAIKRLPISFGARPEARERLAQEAKAITALNHPGIVTLHDYGIDPDGPYIVMEFVEGETLADCLDRDKQLGTEQCVDIFIQVCDALQHAHSRGVIHRDIKPSNIMLADEGGTKRAKVVDFGLARIIHEGHSIERLTQTGELIGSPLYMSPEQCQGYRLDGRTDIYSLGCVLFEALSGAPPFTAEHTLGTVMQHLRAPLRIPANVDKRFHQILRNALEKDRDDRYQSIDQLRDDLQRVRDGQQAIKRSRKRRLKSAVAFGGAIVVACAAVASLFLPEHMEIKDESGKVVYSTWVKHGAGMRAAVSEANALNKDLQHAQLPGANLAGLTIDGTALQFANLAGADLHGTRFERGPRSVNVLEFSDLSNANLKDARLHTQLLEDRFTGANLEQADIDGGLDNDDFSEANLKGSTINNNSGGRQPTSFKKADLSGAHFTGWYPQVNFSYANMHGADLSNATFAGCIFQNADLTGANFQNSDLTGCDFSGAKVDGADFAGAKGLDKTSGLNLRKK